MSISHRFTTPNVKKVIEHLSEIDGFKVTSSEKDIEVADIECRETYGCFSAKVNGAKVLITCSPMFGITLTYFSKMSIHDKREICKVKKKLASWSVFKDSSDLSFSAEYLMSECVYSTNFSFGLDNLELYARNTIDKSHKHFKITFLANSKIAMDAIIAYYKS